MNGGYENGNCISSFMMKSGNTTLQPLAYGDVACFSCAAANVPIKSIVFLNMHVLADCACAQCGQEFWYTLPVGHTVAMPIKIAKNGKASAYPEAAEAWLARPLHDALFRHASVEVEIQKKVLIPHAHTEAILLNTLDSCYGHVFTKLWNAQLLLKKEPDKAIIVLVPEQLAWLVPEGVAEVWSVKAPLHQLDKRLTPLDSFVKQELQRFNRVSLSPAYPHLNTATLDMAALLKANRFPLAHFSERKPRFTFCLREDRFWHASVAGFLLFKVCVKLKILASTKQFFIREQNRLIGKTVKHIQRQLGEVQFTATGLGKTGRLPAIVDDQRTGSITAAVEAQWKEAYAKSQVVIGVHGSNMLIPTSLAAGFIEILPAYKIPHLTEDIVLPYQARYALFLGRHLPQYVSPSLLAMHAVSIIKDFPRLYANTEQQV